MRRVAGTAGLTLAVAIALAAPANGYISPSRDGNALGAAIDTGGFVTGSELSELPPIRPGTVSADATSTSPLTKFPRHGPDFAILTTGNPLLADDRNTSEQSGANLGGPNVRGDSDLDVSVLRLAVHAPDNTNCLSFDFRFLSEEYPEFTHAGFDDAFVAELDSSTWTTSDGELVAPDDFAVGPADDPITIDGVGTTGVAAERATTTTYDAATRLLRASVPISPGDHDLYLSILDQGDRSFDSAVFVDNLMVVGQSSCQPGVVSLDDVDPRTRFRKRLSATTTRRPKIRFDSDDPDATFECKVDQKLWKPCSSPRKLKRMKARKHKVRVRAIDAAGNVDPTPARDKFEVLKD